MTILFNIVASIEIAVMSLRVIDETNIALIGTGSILSPVSYILSDRKTSYRYLLEIWI